MLTKIITTPTGQRITLSANATANKARCGF